MTYVLYRSVESTNVLSIEANRTSDVTRLILLDHYVFNE